MIEADTDGPLQAFGSHRFPEGGPQGKIASRLRVIRQSLAATLERTGKKTVKQTNRPELDQLRQDIEECPNCPLAAVSPKVVFGEGNPYSPLVIVGEGPGEHEEQEGKPFVGRAGQLLDRILDNVGLPRDEVWITNTLKRRASKVVEGRVKNRLPRAAELAIHKAFLDRELKIISPRIILCLGNLAANTLIHRNFRMTQEHGQWFSGPMGKRLLATFHPAYILRLEGEDYQEVLRQTIDDFAAVVAEYRALLAGHRPLTDGHALMRQPTSKGK